MATEILVNALKNIIAYEAHSDSYVPTIAKNALKQFEAGTEVQYIGFGAAPFSFEKFRETFDKSFGKISADQFVEQMELMGYQFKPKEFYSADMMLNKIAEQFNINVADLKKRSRKMEIVQPRHIAMYFLLKRFGKKYSLKGIGLMLGGYNHATVMYARDTVQKNMNDSPLFKGMIDGIHRILREHEVKVEKDFYESLNKK